MHQIKSAKGKDRCYIIAFIERAIKCNRRLWSNLDYKEVDVGVGEKGTINKWSEVDLR